MDKSLDEVVRERQAQKRSDRNRGPRGGNRRGVRKSERHDSPFRSGSDSRGAWIHDKFEEDDLDAPSFSRGSDRKQNGFGAGGRRDRDDSARIPQGAARLRVENIHYELGQEDLLSLFSRIAPPLSVTLKYDRAGRSEGIAYVTYDKETYARRAIDQFDGANAHGQPIYLTLISPSSNGSSGREGKSLFDRVEAPVKRSQSPPTDRGRRGAVRPSGKGSRIDRYVPSDRDRDNRDRERERGTRGDRERDRPIVDRSLRRDGRRAGGGGGGAGGREGGGGTRSVRPKKTVEELDEEMNDYWAAGNADEAAETQEEVGTTQSGGVVSGGEAMLTEDDMMVE